MRPRKILGLRTEMLRLHPLTVQYLEPGYTLYCVDQHRGRCYFDPKVITIPKWAYDKSQAYRTYYLAHELAHAIAFRESGERQHGVGFYKVFLRICPEHLQHYELNYKPRNAAAAGIRRPK